MATPSDQYAETLAELKRSMPYVGTHVLENQAVLACTAAWVMSTRALLLSLCSDQERGKELWDVAYHGQVTNWARLRVFRDLLISGHLVDATVARKVSIDVPDWGA